MFPSLTRIKFYKAEFMVQVNASLASAKAFDTSDRSPIPTWWSRSARQGRCIPDLYDLAHVVAWEPYNLQDLPRVSLVGSVAYRYCTASHNGRLGPWWSRSWSIWSVRRVELFNFGFMFKFNLKKKLKFQLKFQLKLQISFQVTASLVSHTTIQVSTRTSTWSSSQNSCQNSELWL